mmetsp:Transcript_4215/g.8052  ORF Transcript_4215/g.8052 Transcript_4215/m.8052 type:complete len:284 (-) Transcript_4215:234-1085(-)
MCMQLTTLYLLLDIGKLFTHSINCLLVCLHGTGLLEDSRPSNHHIHTSLSDLPNVIHLDTSIDFKTAINSSLVNHLTSLSCLIQYSGDESLSSKSWVNRHEKDNVKFVHNVFGVIKGSSGVENETSLASSSLDKLERPINMVGCLGVEGNIGGSSINKIFDDCINWRNHEMDINGCGHSVITKSFAYHGSNGEVGHIVIIHDVKVNDISSCCKNIVNFLSKTSKVGRKDGGGDEIVLISPHHVHGSRWASNRRCDSKCRGRGDKTGSRKERELHLASSRYNGI